MATGRPYGGAEKRARAHFGGTWQAPSQEKGGMEEGRAPQSPGREACHAPATRTPRSR